MLSKIYLKLFAAILILAANTISAQVGVGTPTPQGALDVFSSTDGLLIPRVALNITTTATVATPTISELVYNTASVNDVTPGFYYWNGTVWVRLATGAATNDWSLTGNAGTTPGTNFLGTTTNVDLRIKTNNADRFDFTSNGRLRSYDQGLATLPTYSWIGDIDTGFFRPAANALAFSTDGTERLRIDPIGNVGIGTTPNASAKLQISATDRGLLIPNVLLTATNVAAPIITPATSLLVYNTATAGTAPNNVTPGYYYWNGSWIRMATGIPTNDWSLTGNAGTSATANYVGTNDARPLRLATNATERMRVIQTTGQVVINNTAAFTSDRFSVYNAPGADYAINGYASANGVGVYGENSGGTGYGVYGLNDNSGIAVLGINLSTGAGVLGVTSGATSAGVFGRADVAGGSAIYGTTNGGTGYAVEGYSSGAAGRGVYGTAIGNGGVGTFGITNAANGSGSWGYNSNASGTGALGSGNNQAATYLVNGSGGAFTGNDGLIGYARAAAGTGVIGVGNNLTGTTIIQGSGGAFNGYQWGAFGNAAISGSPAVDRAAFIGNYNENATASTVYVGGVIGGVHYKILGPGAASVSTTMPTRDGERVLFAPEAPENWFFDIGEATLINGKATVTMDPLFADCIADSKPFKVFVQGAEDTYGSIRVTRNQKNKTFELQDMGGASNGVVQYSIYAIWKQKENLRFPKYEPTFQVQQNNSLTADKNEIRSEKKVETLPINKKRLPVETK